jgi:hypothetical protein
MDMQITQKGRLASIECEKCGATHYWHEWCDDGQADDLKEQHCPECGGTLDPESFWYSPSRNWYAGRYSAPGYLDCTDWNYSKNRREMARELRDMYGDD